MAVGTRLKRIQKQLGMGRDIQRKVLVFCHSLRDGESEAERQAEIDRRIQEAIRLDPTNPFICVFV